MVAALLLSVLRKKKSLIVKESYSKTLKQIIPSNLNLILMKPEELIHQSHQNCFVYIYATFLKLKMSYSLSSQHILELNRKKIT